MIGESSIEINGKKYPLRFTMFQTQTYGELWAKRDMALDHMYVSLVYSAMEIVARKEGKEMPFTYDELYWIIDDIGSDGSGQIDDIESAYKDSHAFKRVDEQQKKMTSQTGTTSEPLLPANSE